MTESDGLAVFVVFAYAGFVFGLVAASFFASSPRSPVSSPPPKPPAHFALVETPFGPELHTDTFYLDASDDDLVKGLRLMSLYGLTEIKYQPDMPTEVSVL